jgi:hypothetical protein
MSEKNLPTEVETQFEALLEEYGRFLRNTIARFCRKNLSSNLYTLLWQVPLAYQAQ